MVETGCVLKRSEFRKTPRIRRVAIVDDFVETGNTIRRIVEEIRESYMSNGQVPPLFPHVVLYKCAYLESQNTFTRLDETMRIQALHPCLTDARIHGVYWDPDQLT